MAKMTPIRTAGLAGLLVLACVIPWQAGMASGARISGPAMQSIQIAASDIGSHAVDLGVSKSLVIDLPRDIKDVLVTDPAIANAVVRSSRRAYIIGIKVGQTNVFFFDAEGKQMAGFDIAVTRDLNGIRAAIRQVLPDADISVEGIGDGIILAGSAASQVDAQQALRFASRILWRPATASSAMAAAVPGVAPALCPLAPVLQAEAALAATRPRKRSSTPSSSAAVIKSCSK